MFSCRKYQKEKMDYENLNDRFCALIQKSTKRPGAARLRDVFDQVESALQAKVPQEEVLAELNKMGIEMTMGAFKSALQRLRKKQKLLQGEKSSPKPQNPVSTTNASQIQSGNPLRILAGAPIKNDFNCIPKSSFEVDKI